MKLQEKTDDMLSYYERTTEDELAEYCKGVYQLKVKAQAEGDLRLVSQMSYEQSRIRKIFQYYNITNIALDGTITNRK